VPTLVPFANVLFNCKIRIGNLQKKFGSSLVKSGSFLIESYGRNRPIGLKIGKLPRKSGELAALCNVELVAVEQSPLITTYSSLIS